MPEEFDSRTFRNACGQFMTGVTVVTARGEQDEPVGLTANSFTSVSLEPPLLLVCLDKNLRTYTAFVQAQGFAVHVLAADQKELCARFATRGADKFAGLATEEGLFGAPILSGAIVSFECESVQRVDAGDHTIIIGEVRRLRTGAEGAPPLGYLRGRYVSAADLPA